MTFPDCVTPWYGYKASQYVKQPCKSNRASQLAGDCTRELVYWRTAWEHAAAPSDDLKVILGEGVKHERELIIELQRAGVQVLETQSALEWRQFGITGHVDFVVVVGDKAIPADCKSMSSHIWDSIFKRGPGVYQWEDVREGFEKKPWTRKYLGQVTLYALMRNGDQAMLLCINKNTGSLAQVNVEVDFAFAESLLKKAEAVNAHVAAGTLPERIPFSADVCPKCPFYSLCLPDHVGVDPLVFVDDALVEEWLEARERHRDARDAYEEADGYVKAWARARPETKISIGRWLLEKSAHGKGVRVDVTQVDPAVVGGAEATQG